MIRRGSLRALLAACALLATGAAPAYETDQHSNRLLPLADSTAALNGKVNASLREILARPRPPQSEAAVVRAVYRSLGGLHWVDRIERWAMRSPQVAKLTTARYRSIYAGHPLWATRVTALFGIGATFKVDGVLIGSDKLGHFFSQGRKFYRRWLRTRDEARAAARSAYTERAIFGQMTTGDYSNADLVANYEGHRFYRSLFEDGIVPGKPAILRREGGRWVLQREFDWADHVNPYWDEALYPNHYDRLLHVHMRKRLMRFCDDYRSAPELWAIAPAEDARLAASYAMLQLRDTRDLRLPILCRRTD